MKKIIVLFFLLSVELTYAQKDTSAIQFIKPPDSTGFGTPDGKLVNNEIGLAGGTIISDDGRVELIFPEAALTVKTTISIQPITNMLNGSGKAYQLEPTGTQFKKGVKIIFHYTDEEAETCPPDLKSFALQDQKGRWTFFEYDDWDSTTKKLSGLIHHFSALVTDQNDVKISTTLSKVRVNSTTEIWAEHRQVIPIPPSLVDVMYPYHEIPEFAGDRLGLFVNGIFKGNSRIGTANINSRWQRWQATEPIGLYHAPEYLPRESPVEIKLAFQYYSRIKKKIVWGTSKCYLRVYDIYKISVKFYQSTAADIADGASFIARIYPNEVIVTDILNYPPTVTNMGDPPQCEAKIILDESCIGTVHIDAGEVGKYIVSKDYPPKIFFELREKENLVYKFQYICKYGSSPVGDILVYSWPHEINFIANGQKQTINYHSIPNSDHKIIVDPIREE